MSWLEFFFGLFFHTRVLDPLFVFVHLHVSGMDDVRETKISSFVGDKLGKKIS